VHGSEQVGRKRVGEYALEGVTEGRAAVVCKRDSAIVNVVQSYPQTDGRMAGRTPDHRVMVIVDLVVTDVDKTCAAGHRHEIFLEADEDRGWVKGIDSDRLVVTALTSGTRRTGARLLPSPCPTAVDRYVESQIWERSGSGYRAGLPTAIRNICVDREVIGIRRLRERDESDVGSRRPRIAEQVGWPGCSTIGGHEDPAAHDRRAHRIRHRRVEPEISDLSAKDGAGVVETGRIVPEILTAID